MTTLKTPSAIPRISTRMSSESQAVLTYVASNANCTFAVLRGEFHPGYKSGSLHSFRSKLNSLVKAGHLAMIYTDGVGTYQTGSGVKRSKPEPAIEPVAIPAYVASRYRITPPAQYDRMHAPHYVPETDPALRPGALDYKRFSSHGHRC